MLPAAFCSTASDPPTGFPRVFREARSKMQCHMHLPRPGSYVLVPGGSWKRYPVARPAPHLKIRRSQKFVIGKVSRDEARSFMRRRVANHVSSRSNSTTFCSFQFQRQHARVARSSSELWWLCTQHIALSSSSKRPSKGVQAILVTFTRAWYGHYF